MLEEKEHKKQEEKEQKKKENKRSCSDRKNRERSKRKELPNKLSELKRRQQTARSVKLVKPQLRQQILR